ncbi:MAG: ATP-binding cassette domain-containing protein [Acetanaerobacterium sp.]
MKYWVTVEHVSKVFQQQRALDDVNISFEQGQIHGIIGRNGSGKTVLFKCICGLMLPSSGRILVKNKLIGKDIDVPESVGIIIEAPGFLPQYSGAKNLKLLADIKRTAHSREITDAMVRVGLDPASKKRVGQYSLGMRQRLGIAQAIMEDPELLILDEPMNGLDNAGVEDIRKLLLSLKEQGKTILIASHNREDVEILCDHVYEMDKGRLTVKS